jgi:hypothetical protein
MPTAPTPADLVARPTAYIVGDHSLLLAENVTTWRWTATMDGRLLEGTFRSQAEAWEAGVREAALVDGASRPAGR